VAEALAEKPVIKKLKLMLFEYYVN